MANKQYVLALDVSTKSTGIALKDDTGFIARSYELKTKSTHKGFASRMAEDMGYIEQGLLGVNGAIQYLIAAHTKYNEWIQNELSKELDKKLSKDDRELLRDESKKNTNLYQETHNKAVELKKACWEALDKIELLVVIETNKVQVNQDVKQKLDLYAGMYLGYIVDKLNTLCPYFIRSFKFASPTEWRAHAYGYFPERKEAKELAIDKANKLLKEQGQNREVEGDDEAEAIVIALVADHLRDIATVYNQRQDRANNLKRLRGQLPRHEGLVKKYLMIQTQKLKTGKDLTKAERNVLETNLHKVQEIKDKISKLNGGVYGKTKQENN